MRFYDFMALIRQWDNRANQWFIRLFYVLFFEILLVLGFVALFIMTVNLMTIGVEIDKHALVERLLFQQNALGVLIAFLILLNSFCMLFMFSGLQRIRSILKNIDFNLSRRPNDRKVDDSNF